MVLACEDVLTSQVLNIDVADSGAEVDIRVSRDRDFLYFDLRSHLDNDDSVNLEKGR